MALKKFIKIILLCLLLIACENKKSKYVVVSEDPFIEYSKEGNDLFLFHSVFNPGRANDLTNEGISLLKENKFKEAKIKFNNAYEMEPNNPVVLNNLGLVQLEERNFEKAIEYFEESLIASDSTYFLALNNLAESYGIIGEDEKSEEIYNFTISKTEIDFLKGISYLNLALMYLNYGKIHKSKIAFHNAKLILTKYNDFNDELAYLEFEIKHYYD